MKGTVVLVVLCLWLGHVECGTTCPQPHPVVLVPGVGGSILEGLLDLSDDIVLPHDICPHQTTEWTRWWIDNRDMEPPMEDCLLYYLTPQWINGSMQNPEGIDIRTPDWGGVYAIDILDPDLLMELFTHYFHGTIQGFEDAGYVVGTNLFGAPYDWRYFPSPSYCEALQELVEQAFALNNNTKVELVSHSLGGPVSYYFLQNMEEEWKEKFLHRWITLSSPWYGSVQAIKYALSGDNFGLPVPHINYRAAQRAMPATYYLLALPQYWNTTVLVTTPSATYSAEDYQTLWNVADIDHAWELTQEAWTYYGELNFPVDPDGVAANLPHICMYSYGEKTDEQYVYTSDTNFDDNPKITWGDGDGTVNAFSLSEQCALWAASGNTKAIYTYSDVDHVGILSDSRAVDQLVSLACSD
ncbi:Group XV phospholipase A2 [Pelomyxa schiedti]|nr:Group XV phospholipase A2 [Pelomyxa schiedti]